MLLLLPPALPAAESADGKTMVDLMDDYGPRLRLVDARKEVMNGAATVGGAVVFSATLRVGAGTVLVIGDDDATALAAAATLEKRDQGVRAYAAQGGVEGYRAARAAWLAIPDITTSSQTFVIPTDTCQPGEPAHVFEAQ